MSSKEREAQSRVRVRFRTLGVSATFEDCRGYGQARREGRRLGGGGRLQPAFQHAGEGGNYGVV